MSRPKSAAEQMQELNRAWLELFRPLADALVRWLEKAQKEEK